uniref:Uncharacterized protein n=1 Tax=Rhizophora mucronata TaxID=61149 RepID=A0A2P2K8Q7_RHIMU
MWPLLKLGGLDSNGDADEENAGHGDGGVAAPVLGPAVRASAHAPHLLPEVPVDPICSVPMFRSSSHVQLICGTPFSFLNLDDWLGAVRETTTVREERPSL